MDTKSQDVAERLSRAEDVMRKVAERQASREESARLQAERAGFAQKTAERLEQEAQLVAQLERERVTKELADARSYENAVVGSESRAHSSEEQKRLYRQQQEFLRREQERIATEENSMRKDELKRLKAEREQHDYVQQARTQEELAAVQRRERERLEQVDGAAQDTSNRWARDIETRKAQLVQQKRELEQSQTSLDASSSGEKRKLILIMTVEIGDGRVETVRVYSDSRASDLAEEFVQKHGLAPAIVGPLTDHISTSVAALPRKQQSLNSSASTPMPSERGSGTVSPRSPTRDDHLRRLSTEVSKIYEDRRRERANMRSPELTLTPRIDDKSRKLAQRARGDGPVFDRLHHQASAHKMKVEELMIAAKHKELEEIEKAKIGISVHSREIMKTRTKADFENYGQRLYAEGLQSKEKREVLAEKARQERKDPDATFQPQISEIARRLKRPTSAPAWDRMTEAAMKKQAALEKARKEQEEKETQGCTFRPAISERTKKLVKEKLKAQGALPAHEALFMDAERRRMRSEEYQNWYPEEVTFHPDLGPNRDKPMKDQSQEDFLQRLVNSKAEREKFLLAERRMLEDSIDPHTGQPLFHPLVGRGPTNRNPHDLPIYEYLYHSRHQFGDIRNVLQARQEQELKDLANTKKVRSKSESLLENAKNKRLHDLFELWDKDGDGLINVQDIDPQVILDDTGRDVLAMIKDEQVEALTFNEFCQYVERLLRSTAHGPTSHLFTTHTDTDKRSVVADASDLTFRPAINPVSEALAAKRRTSSAPVHEQLVLEASIREKRLQKLAEEKQELELAACTFKPKTHAPEKLDARSLESLTRRLSTPTLKAELAASTSGSDY